MTKLFIENANREAPASIRIYPLDENSQVVAPDSFTSMDDLGLSFGIALAPKTGIDCTGGENSTPWLNSSENSNMELWIDGELVASDVFFGRRYTLNGPIDGTMELTNLLLEYDIQLDVEETNLEA